MKNLIFIFTFLFSVINISIAQLVPKPKSLPIEVSTLSIKNTGNLNSINYSEPAMNLIQAFGVPSSTEPYLFEMEDKSGTLYKYGSNEFYFMENKLYQFQINSNNYEVLNGTYSIKIGDPLSAINNFYPNYTMDNNFIIVRIKSSAGVIDGAIVIETNGTSITKIDFNIH